MELFIRARQFYFETDERIPIHYVENEKFTEVSGLCDRMRFVVLHMGTGILRINDKKIAIVAPAILCINDREDIHLEESVGWEATGFYFHPQYINHNLTFEKVYGKRQALVSTDRQDVSLLDAFTERSGQYAGILNLDPLSLRSMIALLNSIHTEISEQSHSFWSCRARSYFLELLFMVASIYRSPEKKANAVLLDSSSLTDRIILYLNTHYGEKITLSDLCKRFNTNKTTLQEQFKKAMGQSVMSYLIALRVNLSALMLKDTRLAATEIADRLGFSDYAHFHRMFQKHIGHSPLQYRKQFTAMKF